MKRREFVALVIAAPPTSHPARMRSRATSARDAVI
jgi:hypothetical protein